MINYIKLMIENPLVTGIAGFLIGIAIEEFLKDRFYGVWHKRRSNEAFKSLGKPQVSVFSIRSNEDIIRHTKRLNPCNGLYQGELSLTGDGNKTSVILNLEKIEPLECTLVKGYIRLIHIENGTEYSCCVRDIKDGSNNSVLYTCPHLWCMEKNSDVTLLHDAYKALSKIVIDYNGHRLEYTITDKEGSIEPTVE